MNSIAVNSHIAGSAREAMATTNKSMMQRLGSYLLDNASYFAADAAMRSGNGAAAARIMQDARAYEAAQNA